MVRATNAVSSLRRKRRMLKRAKGFWGDRKNHLRQTSNAVDRALAYNYQHRKLRKRDFRSLWISRLSIAAKINGMSYNKLVHGLKLAQCDVNRKMLSEMAIHDPQGFALIAEQAKKALQVEAA